MAGVVQEGGLTVFEVALPEGVGVGVAAVLFEEVGLDVLQVEDLDFAAEAPDFGGGWV